MLLQPRVFPLSCCNPAAGVADVGGDAALAKLEASGGTSGTPPAWAAATPQLASGRACASPTAQEGRVPGGAAAPARTPAAATLQESDASPSTASNEVAAESSGITSAVACSAGGSTAAKPQAAAKQHMQTPSRIGRPVRALLPLSHQSSLQRKGVCSTNTRAASSTTSEKSSEHKLRSNRSTTLSIKSGKRSAAIKARMESAPCDEVLATASNSSNAKSTSTSRRGNLHLRPRVEQSRGKTSSASLTLHQEEATGQATCSTPSDVGYERRLSTSKKPEVLFTGLTRLLFGASHGMDKLERP